MIAITNTEGIMQISIPDMVICGTGEFAGSVPGIPAPAHGDMARDAASDYGSATTDQDRAWIRRAVHAESFAAAIEKELNALRSAK